MKPAYYFMVRSLWRQVRLLLVCGCLVALCLSYVPPHAVMGALAAPGQGPQAEVVGVQIATTGSIQLRADAGAAPLRTDSPYEHYGSYLAPAQSLTMPTSRVRVVYTASLPGQSDVQLDVRASSDGRNWTAWQTGLASGAMVDFPLEAQTVQYRARLFGNAGAQPEVHAVEIQPVAPTASANPAQAPAAQRGAVAPTYKIWATRLGLVGWRTANGHIIQPRDQFVALPSWRSLSSRGGNEYQVRITYKGRSAVAPVWDVGPWNTRDDYWSVEREVYRDLPRGWPQDHAAYFDGHNGGYAEHGYVRFPTAIDVADGIWWDQLGIRGDRAEVEVTFLWLGQDPLAVPPPSSDPNASEYMVDELGPAFHASGSTMQSGPVGCGHGDHAFWTLTVTDPAEGDVSVFWDPVLPRAGLYDLYAHVPVCEGHGPTTSAARYLIQHRDGAEEVIIDQTEQTGWVRLGRFPFAAGAEGYVHLSDVAGDSYHVVRFDNMKWVPVR